MSDEFLLRGLTWEELALDRRPRRLKRGRHFRGGVRDAEYAASSAAARMGLTVRCVRDDFRRYAYIWVQFADFDLPIGEPCPGCDGRDIVKTHEHFARCTTCDAHLALSPGLIATDGGNGAAAIAGVKSQRKLQRILQRQLDTFTDVELVIDPEQSSELQQIWYGRARYAGEDVLIRVAYPLRDGKRQPHPDRPDQDMHYVSYWSLPHIERAVALGLFSD